MSAFDTISFVIIFILSFIFLIWSIRNLLLSPEERRKKILKLEMEQEKIKQDMLDKANKHIEAQREIDERLRKELEVELGMKSPSSSIEEDSDTIEQERSNRYIPSSVRREVWRRDKGKCVNCWSRKNLEYDHIIPVSEGGSNTARNIELLCEECNRKKSNKIE